MGDILKWVAVVVEFIGLSLIAIELYLPGSSEKLTQIFDGTINNTSVEPEPRRDWYWIFGWSGLYVMAWIVVGVAVSIWDPSMSVVANVAFTVATVFLFVLIGIIRLLLRLGVVLGRGNSVGGVGLVMALIGFSIEVSQLIVT